jgi:hypothetical protein
VLELGENLGRKEFPKNRRDLVFETLFGQTRTQVGELTFVVLVRSSGATRVPTTQRKIGDE